MNPERLPGLPRPLRRAAGLTLLEVLLAFTLLSLAGAIVYGALNTALVAWSAGVTRGRNSQVAGIALDRMAQQLSSIVPAVIIEGGERKVAFEADENSLHFVTFLPTGSPPLAQVSYSIEEGEEGPRLVYREYPWPDKDFFADPLPVREEALPEIEGMEIITVAGEEEPEEEPDFPEEVEIRLRPAGEEAGTEERFTAHVPLMVRPWRRR